MKETLFEKATVLNRLIDAGFNRVRGLDWPKFAAVGGRCSASLGVIAFYLFGVAGFVAGTISICRSGGWAFDKMICLALLPLILAVLSAYFGPKFMAGAERCIDERRTPLPSSAVMDGLAAALVLCGVIGLFAGIVMEDYLHGALRFVAALLFALAAVRPDIAGGAASDGVPLSREAIGVAEFFLKAILRIVPFAWFAGAAFCAIRVIVHLGSKNVGTELGFTMQTAIPLAAMPVVVYFAFLLFKLVAGVAEAVLGRTGGADAGQGAKD